MDDVAAEPGEDDLLELENADEEEEETPAQPDEGEELEM